MSMLYLYIQFTNLNSLPEFTNQSINVSPVLAFTKPISDGLLAWHVTLPDNSHLGYRVNSGKCRSIFLDLKVLFQILTKQHLTLLTLAISPLSHQHNHLEKPSYWCQVFLNEDLLKDEKGHHGPGSHKAQPNRWVMGLRVMPEIWPKKRFQMIFGGDVDWWWIIHLKI